MQSAPLNDVAILLFQILNAFYPQIWSLVQFFQMWNYWVDDADGDRLWTALHENLVIRWGPIRTDHLDPLGRPPRSSNKDDCQVEYFDFHIEALVNELVWSTLINEMDTTPTNIAEPLLSHERWILRFFLPQFK
jgi:hypothetical protein